VKANATQSGKVKSNKENDASAVNRVTTELKPKQYGVSNGKE
jgi:hypothetical protein